MSRRVGQHRMPGKPRAPITLLDYLCLLYIVLGGSFLLAARGTDILVGGSALMFLIGLPLVVLALGRLWRKWRRAEP